MSLAPGDLPLLLAGPVLRRVEADLVCVWMATSQPCNASLLLFDGGDVAASDTPLGDQRAEWVSDVQATLRIGPHLHVLAITLDLRTPGGNAVRTNGTLLPNRTYSYDLNFFTRDDPATRHTLRTEGLLNDPVPLGYDRGELPSFVTPPDQREQLVILHGSCRELFAVPPVEDEAALDDDPFEPPGGWPTAEVTPDDPAPVRDPENDPFPSDAYPTFPKRDGMVWVDALIDQRASLPQFRFAGRPHQLFLTGDQIYADSMSAVVLPVLNHVGRLLVGDEDLGSKPVDATTVAAILQNFPPAFRRGVAVRSAYFTMSGGSSHVFSFGEFIAHYLLAWSPALWEKTDLSKDGFNKALWPDAADFNPETIPMPEDFFLQWTFKDEVEGTHTDDYYTLKEALRELKEEHPDRTDIPGPNAPEHDQVDWFFRQRRDWIASKYWSPDLFEWYTRRFRAGLPRVRRALANVPTYMIGDDHEITDDWYFSRQWRERVFTRTLGVDIIRNGLTAYTVMQAWGNDPRRWSQGSEANLLQAIGAFMALTPGERRTSSDRVHELLGLPRPAPPPGSPPQPTPTFRPLVEFSYQVEGPCHRVLVVDGRTKRRFPHRLSQAGGIDYEGGNALLPDDVHPTGLPGEQSFGLFGDSPMAAALPPRPTADTKITLVVLGVPALGPEGMELALVPFQRLARLLLERRCGVVVLRARHLRGAAGLARALRVGGPAVGRHPRRFHGLRGLLVGAQRGTRAHGAHRPAGVERPDEGLGRVRPGLHRPHAVARDLRIRHHAHAAPRRARGVGHAAEAGAGGAADDRRHRDGAERIRGPSDVPRAAADARAGGADARLAGRNDRSARPELGLARLHGARRARGVPDDADGREPHHAGGAARRSVVAIARGLARRGCAPHGLRPRVLLPAERRRRHLREGPPGPVGGAPRAGRRAAADAADARSRLHAGGPAAVHRAQGVADAARAGDLAVRPAAHRRRRRLGRRRQRSGVPAAAARPPAVVGTCRRLHRRRRDLRRQPGGGRRHRARGGADRRRRSHRAGVPPQSAARAGAVRDQ